MPSGGLQSQCPGSPAGIVLPRATLPVQALFLAAALLGAIPPGVHAVERAEVSPAAPAQVVEGRILDATDGTPVPQAVVRLVDSEGETVVSTLSDGDGWFRLAAPGP
ncbi:MAG: carboxypeptidase-like regulatory domain-containing protein, partial [Gemmatimonadota bacterium]